jgi:hypothetical protein
MDCMICRHYSQVMIDYGVCEVVVRRRIVGETFGYSKMVMVMVTGYV